MGGPAGKAQVGERKEELRLGRGQGWIDSGLGHIISLFNDFSIFLIIISAGFDRKTELVSVPTPQTTTSCNKKEPFQISKSAKLLPAPSPSPAPSAGSRSLPQDITESTCS